jgi:hypothetical protein
MSLIKKQKNKESLDSFSDVIEETVSITVKLTGKPLRPVKLNKDNVVNIIQDALEMYCEKQREDIADYGDWEKPHDYLATQVSWHINTTPTQEMNKLVSRYDASQYQWQDKPGRIFKLEELTKEDLMQAVCECIETIDKAENICLDQLRVFDEWRNQNK